MGVGGLALLPPLPRPLVSLRPFLSRARERPQNGLPHLSLPFPQTFFPLPLPELKTLHIRTSTAMKRRRKTKTQSAENSFRMHYFHPFFLKIYNQGRLPFASFKRRKTVAQHPLYIYKVKNSDFMYPPHRHFYGPPKNLKCQRKKNDTLSAKFGGGWVGGRTLFM